MLKSMEKVCLMSSVVRMSKKYYWLKLKEDFFRSKEIKKLRKIAGGDTYTIIYLKLQLLSIKTEGLIEFDGTEQNMIEQLALEIDEDADNIGMTITYLINNKLIESNENQNILVSSVIPLIGKETDSAERVRKHRELHQKALQCNVDVTKCNTELEKEKELEKREDNTIAQKSTAPHEYYLSVWNNLFQCETIATNAIERECSYKLKGLTRDQVRKTIEKYKIALESETSWIETRVDAFSFLTDSKYGFNWFVNATPDMLKRKGNKPQFKQKSKYGNYEAIIDENGEEHPF